MINQTASASLSGPDSPKPAYNFPKDMPAKDAEGARPGASGQAARAGDPPRKNANRDGDRLEISPETGAASRNPAPGETAAADESAEADPKAKQLADLREWAKQVEHEVRQQQQKMFEQMLRQSGRHVEAGEGRFMVLFVSDAPEKVAGETEGSEEELQVPAYWNAENTSDRIVHFATQMAEISGLAPKEFADIIKKAVGDGFDQAQEATGELPGAAGKLNRDTRKLVFDKLSKWLEEQEAKVYNEGTRNPAVAGSGNASGQGSQTLTAEVPDGTQNHQQ